MDARLREAIENGDRPAVEALLAAHPELADATHHDAQGAQDRESGSQDGEGGTQDGEEGTQDGEEGSQDGEGVSQEGVSAVLFAVYRRQEEIAGMLLEARGRPPDVFEAAAMGLDDALDDLLGRADAAAVEGVSPDGFTALHLAAYFGHAEAVRRLLRAGADVHAVSRNDSRLYVLNSGAAGGDVGVVEALLAGGADPDSRQAGGYTPLMGAAAAGSRGMVDRLLGAGGDPASTSEDGRTAADLARERGHPDLADRLDAAVAG